jgi:hypothetical protein
MDPSVAAWHDLRMKAADEGVAVGLRRYCEGEEADMAGDPESREVTCLLALGTVLSSIETAGPGARGPASEIDLHTES